MAVAVLVGVEAGLAEEDACADALCVADGVDGVLGELCSVWVSGHPFPSLNVWLDKGISQLLKKHSPLVFFG